MVAYVADMVVSFTVRSFVSSKVSQIWMSHFALVTFERQLSIVVFHVNTQVVFCHKLFITFLTWAEASSTSTNPNIFLVRLCCSQHETDEEVILSRQTNSLVINQTLLMPHQDEPNSLVINQRVWFVLFVVNQSHRHIWLFGLPCLLSTNPTVIFDGLICLVVTHRHIWLLDLSCLLSTNFS